MRELTRELYDEILKNGGLTLDKNFEKIDKKTGFMVSVEGFERRLDKFTYEDIKAVADEYKSLLKGCLYLGFWIDDGALYIDISKWFRDKSEALKFGKQNKQIAIFDLRTNESIRVIYDEFYYLIDTKTTLNVGTFDNLEQIKNVLSLKNSTKSLYINNILDKKLLLDRYEIYRDVLYYEDIFNLEMEV